VRDEHGLAVSAARHPAAVVAEIDDVEFERGLVDPGHVASGCVQGPDIVADAMEGPALPVPLRLVRRHSTPRMSYRLLLLPDPALLVPPARARARDPLAGEDVADLRLPFGMAMGHGDLPVDRLAAAVAVGDGGVDRDPVLDRQLRGITHH